MINLSKAPPISKSTDTSCTNFINNSILEFSGTSAVRNNTWIPPPPPPPHLRPTNVYRTPGRSYFIHHGITQIYKDLSTYCFILFGNFFISWTHEMIYIVFKLYFSKSRCLAQLWIVNHGSALWSKKIIQQFII